jgi:hypothetical protein
MARKKKTENIEEENTMIEDAMTEEENAMTEGASAPEKTKRDIIIETIQAGGATMETLTEAADCKYASVMSIFSMLRLMGYCPVKDVPVTETDEEGNEVTVMTYRLVSPEEWEAIKAEKASKVKAKRAPKKSPEEQLEALKKRIEKLTTTNESAQGKALDYPSNEILQLRAQKASIELRITELERDNLEEKINS